MAGGCTSVLLGRRGTYEKCKYWIRDEDEKDLTEYVYENQPSGTFWAEEITAEDLNKLIINNSFMFDNSLITIFTKAQITLKQGDIIEFENELWMVQSCQQKRIHKNNQFMKRPNKVSYIQLKR